MAAPSPSVSFYPPPPAPTVNAFGEFVFGVSPFGTIPPFNWLLTVISQYANSPIMLALLASFFAAVDQTKDFDEFYDDIWNIATAQGYGLDVWGRIVGVVRQLNVAGGKFVGFTEGNADGDYDTLGPGGASPFYAGTGASTSYALSDATFRQLILAKAAFNICDGSIPAINSLLMNLFGSSGRAYVADDGGMRLTWTFDFVPTPLQLSIIYNSGVLPRPAGVSASVSHL